MPSDPRSIVGLVRQTALSRAAKEADSAASKNHEDTIRALENELVLANSLLEAIEDALSGTEPSDFMLSFPLVRKAWDAAIALRAFEAADEP